jgi:hypothetical protein
MGIFEQNFHWKRKLNVKKPVFLKL